MYTYTQERVILLLHLISAHVVCRVCTRGANELPQFRKTHHPDAMSIMQTIYFAPVALAFSLLY